MYIIFLSWYYGVVCFVYLQLWLLMLVGVCVVGVSLLVGGFMGVWLFCVLVLVVGIEVDVVLQVQSVEISSVCEDVQWQMDVLSVYFGELQVCLVWLDVFGECFIELVDVDFDEFDFFLSVGQGGVDELLEGSVYVLLLFMVMLDELVVCLDICEQQFEVLE